MDNTIVINPSLGGRIWVENSQGEISSIELKPYITMTTLRCKSDQKINIRDITPELPEGIKFNNSTGMISGKPVVDSSSAVYTISGINSNQTLTTTFTLSISGCEYGKYIFAVKMYGNAFINILKDGISYFNATLKENGPYVYPICIPKQIYNYEFTCDDIPLCKMYINDKQGNYYMNAVAFQSMNEVTGTIEITPTQLPIVHLPSLLAYTSGSNIEESIRIEGVHTGLTITPDLPEVLTLQNLFDIEGRATESRLMTFIITVSNSLGTTTYPFTIAVDQCPPHCTCCPSPSSIRPSKVGTWFLQQTK